MNDAEKKLFAATMQGFLTTYEDESNYWMSGK